MRKAYIYFNGQLLQHVKFEKISFEADMGLTKLTIGFGDSLKIVALVPNTHFILIE